MLPAAAAVLLSYSVVIVHFYTLLRSVRFGYCCCAPYASARVSFCVIVKLKCFFNVGAKPSLVYSK